MVDYEDLEPEGEWSSAFRRKLIDGMNGSQSYHPVTSTPDNAYVIGEKRTWFFRPIAKTPYRYYAIYIFTLVLSLLWGASTASGINIIDLYLIKSDKPKHDFI